VLVAAAERSSVQALASALGLEAKAGLLAAYLRGATKKPQPDLRKAVLAYADRVAPLPTGPSATGPSAADRPVADPTRDPPALLGEDLPGFWVGYLAGVHAAIENAHDRLAAMIAAGHYWEAATVQAIAARAAQAAARAAGDATPPADAAPAAQDAELQRRVDVAPPMPEAQARADRDGAA